MNGFCSELVVGVVGGELGIMWMLEGSGNAGDGGGGRGGCRGWLHWIRRGG